MGGLWVTVYNMRMNLHVCLSQLNPADMLKKWKKMNVNLGTIEVMLSIKFSSHQLEPPSEVPLQHKRVFSVLIGDVARLEFCLFLFFFKQYDFYYYYETVLWFCKKKIQTWFKTDGPSLVYYILFKDETGTCRVKVTILLSDCHTLHN